MTVALQPASAPRIAALHRPPASNRWRFIRAYTTTFLVIGSYSWLGVTGRLFGRAFRDARIMAVHRRYARRVEGTFLALQG
ncbi:MAG: hypothetical protein ACLQVI_11940, partial [Polyangiaceae bacterium]